jgi:hypothetical protein
MRICFALILAGSAVTSCAAPKPQPAPQLPAAKPLPATPLPAAPVQPQGHWTDWQTTPGSWIYRRDDRGSIALYGPAGGDAVVTLRCDRGRGRLFLSRAGSSGATLTVRTSSASKTVAVRPTGGQPPYIASEFLPDDALLDAMAFSRGRIALEVPEMLGIAIPVWSEIGRVVEDCRA